MDDHEPTPALDLLLIVFGMVALLSIGLLVLRKTHSWPWPQDPATFAPASSKHQTNRPLPSTTCSAGRSCLVEDLRCTEHALICKNHLWQSAPCVENDPCPPNSICKNANAHPCDSTPSETAVPVSIQARQPR